MSDTDEEGMQVQARQQLLSPLVDGAVSDTDEEGMQEIIDDADYETFSSRL